MIYERHGIHLQFGYQPVIRYQTELPQGSYHDKIANFSARTIAWRLINFLV